MLKDKLMYKNLISLRKSMRNHMLAWFSTMNKAKARHILTYPCINCSRYHTRDTYLPGSPSAVVSLTVLSVVCCLIHLCLHTSSWPLSTLSYNCNKNFLPLFVLLMLTVRITLLSPCYFPLFTKVLMTFNCFLNN